MKFHILLSSNASIKNKQSSIVSILKVTERLSNREQHIFMTMKKQFRAASTLRLCVMCLMVHAVISTIRRLARIGVCCVCEAAYTQLYIHACTCIITF